MNGAPALVRVFIVIVAVAGCSTGSSRTSGTPPHPGEHPPDDFDAIHSELHAHPEMNEPPFTKEPVVTKKVDPIYPREALIGCKRGWVFMEFTIDTEGRPENIEIVAQDFYKLFGSRARYALSQWRFEPAERNGRTVERQATMPMIFPMPRGCREEN